MIIYKYLDEKGTIATIRSGRVLLRCPIEYNDPFDSIFKLDEIEINNSYKLYVNYKLFLKAYDSLIERKNRTSIGGFITRGMMMESIKKIKETNEYTFIDYIDRSYKIMLRFFNLNEKNLRLGFKNEMKVVMDAMRDNVLVSCFGSTYKSLLMWSHYANKHKGACLKYEIDDVDFQKVTYSKQFKTYRLYDVFEILFGHEFCNKEVDTNIPENKFFLDPILTKASCWKYEGETRCVYPKHNLDGKIKIQKSRKTEKYLLKMPKIKCIYIGCNAEEKFKNKIRNIARDTKIVFMKKSEDDYKVLIDLK